MAEKIKPAKSLGEGYISLEEFCRRVGVSGATMWRMRKAGQGPKQLFRVGSRRLAICEADAAAWMEKRAVA